MKPSERAGSAINSFIFAHMESLKLSIQGHIQEAVEEEREGCAKQLEGAATKLNHSEGSLVRGLAQSLRDRK